MKEIVKKDRFDYPDGTYTIKEVYDKSFAITTYGNNDKVLSVKWYSDKELKKLIATANFEYNEDKSFTKYSVYKIPQETSKYLSSISYHNESCTNIETKLYKDKNFKNLCATEKREYNNEFTEYKSELVYSEPFYGKYYSVKTIEKSGKEKHVFYYTDANFTLLAKEYIYSADGSNIVKNILSERNGKGCLSTIDFFNNENKWIKPGIQ